MGRVMDWLVRRRFLALLLAQGLLLIVYPIVRGVVGARLLFGALLTLVFLAALQVVVEDRRLRILAFVLGLPPVVGLWTGYVLPDLPRLPLLVGFHLSAVLFLGFAIAVLLRAVAREAT